jgi:hypothetical protein
MVKEPASPLKILKNMNAAEALLRSHRCIVWPHLVVLVGPAAGNESTEE